MTFVAVVVLVVTLSAPVVGQVGDIPTEQDVSVLLELDSKNEQQVEEIKTWLESDRSDNYPDLKQRAEAYIDGIEQDREEATEGLSGSQRISEDVRVIGYDFDGNNESVVFTLELDETTNLVIQDMGAMAESGRFEWRSEEFDAGVHRIEMKAVETNIGGTYTQRIAIADLDAQIGNTIDTVTGGGSLFDSVEPWMIPLAGLSGALTVVVLIIRKVRKMDSEGVNEFIPLE